MLQMGSDSQEDSSCCNIKTDSEYIREERGRALTMEAYVPPACKTDVMK